MIVVRACSAILTGLCCLNSIICIETDGHPPCPDEIPVLTAHPIVFAGIEWDDPTRGKHDGSVVTADGSVVRYFSCPPGSGSFLKVNLVDAGIPFLAALVAKYEDATTAGGVVQTEGGQSLEIELVGDEKIRWGADLRCVCVRVVDGLCLVTHRRSKQKVGRLQHAVLRVCAFTLCALLAHRLQTRDFFPLRNATSRPSRMARSPLLLPGCRSSTSAATCSQISAS